MVGHMSANELISDTMRVAREMNWLVHDFCCEFGVPPEWRGREWADLARCGFFSLSPRIGKSRTTRSCGRSHTSLAQGASDVHESGVLGRGFPMTTHEVR